ncbi:leucine rich repeat protein, partial [Striga asiatica]
CSLPILSDPLFACSPTFLLLILTASRALGENFLSGEGQLSIFLKSCPFTSAKYSTVSSASATCSQTVSKSKFFDFLPFLPVSSNFALRIPRVVRRFSSRAPSIESLSRIFRSFSQLFLGSSTLSSFSISESEERRRDSPMVSSGLSQARSRGMSFMAEVNFRVFLDAFGNSTFCEAWACLFAPLVSRLLANELFSGCVVSEEAHLRGASMTGAYACSRDFNTMISFSIERMFPFIS